jgi:RNA polymerase sigma factor (sigma-70 family)
MADGKLRDVLHHMRTRERVRTLRGHGDGALLERFVANNDEAAFEVLVQRHGPMVHGVCRRILADSHDAEDAFQATFLVLARRAATIRTPDAIGAWLHAVAVQVATRARKARTQRNRVHILTELDIGQTTSSESVDAEWRELRPVLDEELGRLPEKYRAPVVLCYLEERSNAEAAEQLGWPIGTVKGRLARARSLLQTRLARRGVALGATLLATAGASRTALAAAVPVALGTATVQQAMLIATGAAPVMAGTTPAVAALYKGGLLAMKLSRIKLFGALLGLLGVCAFSSVFTYSALAGRDPAHSPRFSSAPVVLVKAPVPQEKEKDKDKDKKAETASTDPAGVTLEVKLTGAKESYKLDLGGMSAEEFKKMMDDLAKPPRRPGTRYPASPTVDLKLELTNTGKEEIKVQIRGNENKLTGELKGPTVVYAPIVPQNFLPIRRPPEVVTIAPGKSITITEIPTLAILKPGTGSQAYWTTAGEYTLTVDYNLGVSPSPEKAKDLGNGFGEVKVHSAPITLKVVEAK